MVKKNFKKISILFIAIFLIGFISTKSEVGSLSHLITEFYGPGEHITGWVNLSLKNEPTTSRLYSSIDNIEDNINLLELLKKSSNINFAYSCIPLDCDSNYIARDEGSSKNFSLNDKESTSIGFKITHMKLITDVSGFSLNVTSSDNSESLKLPLTIDVLNDGIIDFEANIASGNFGTKDFGCYIDSTSNKEAGIITSRYCEKVTLPISPNVEIGANVIGTETVEFIMSIGKSDQSFRETCSVTATGSGEIKCSPEDFVIEEGGDYFVCIGTTDSDDDNKYKIKYEEDNPCGFSGDYSNSYEHDFNIFASSGKYAPFKNILLEGNSIKDNIEDYLFSKYENNCTNGCIIPIKFSSGVTQQINLTEPSLNYVAGISTNEKSLYTLEEVPAQMNSNFQKLYLDGALFSVPKIYKEYIFSISLEEDELFSENISVERVPTIKFLTPIRTAAKYQTNFIVYTNWSSNLVEYFWDFGDGSNKTTVEEKVSHTYNSEGTYKVNVKVTDGDDRSASKIFTINVLSVSEIVPLLLEQSIAGVKEIKKQLVSFSNFEKKSIIYMLNLNETEEKILGFNESISRTTSEGEYGEMFEELLLMNIPQSVEITTVADRILFYPQEKYIDVLALEKIDGGNYNIQDEDAYKDAILAWYNENIETTLNYREISADYGRYKLPLVNLFEIKIKNTGEGEDYIIFKKLEGLFYNEDYSSSEWGSYEYIAFTGSEDISFSTSEEINFETLPLFIAPKISELVVIEGEITSFEESSKKWIIFGIIIGLIILISFGIWMGIRLWYKKKYEDYLFKDRNNLYNLVNYIDAEKKKGTKEQEILSNLKKAGWNPEQIKYALKRHSGKKII